MSNSPDYPLDWHTPLAASSRHHLPALCTSFVGRARELHKIKSLFSTTRLLTLTGTGGIGKTRCALQAAHELVHEDRELFPDGVWFVSLAQLQLSSDIVPTLARALGWSGEVKRALIYDFLRPKGALLILDGCEHLIASCARLAEELLHMCPDLRILATSRETLRVGGETVYCLLPLAVPLVSDELAPEDLTRFDATALFLERASALHPYFRATTNNAAALVEICQQLDGIPLAIELAAARIRLMSAEQIAARVGDSSGGRFSLLTSGSRTALPHQQTLRATLDWSYALLSSAEQRLFQRLAIFTGSWTLESAQAVCVTEGWKDLSVVDGLARLIDTSLVLVDRQAGVQTSLMGDILLCEQARYTWLETVRQYALEKLQETGDEEALQQKYLLYFLRLAEKIEPELRGASQSSWLAYLDREHEAFQAALTYAREQRLYEAGLRLANALWWFWMLRANFGSGRVWLEEIASLEEQVRPQLQAIAFYRAGMLAFFQGDLERLDVFTEKSLALFRVLEDTQGIAVSLSNLVHVALRQRNHERAWQLGEESVALARTVGDRWFLALMLLPQAVLSIRQKDYTAAGTLINESLWHFRTLGDRWGMAYAFDTLGQLADAQHDYSSGITCYEQSLKLLEQLNDRIGIARALLHLGFGLLKQEQYMRASSLLEESLRLCRLLGRRIGVARALLGLGRIKLYYHDDQAAAFLFGECLPIFREHGDVRGFASALESLRDIAHHQGQSWQVSLLLRHSLGERYHIDDPSNMLASLESIVDSDSAQTALLGRMRPAGWLKRVISVLHEVESTPASEQSIKEDYIRHIIEENIFVSTLLHSSVFVDDTAAALFSGGAPVSDMSAASPHARTHLLFSPINPLTSREQEVLQLVEHGLSNAQVAQRLVISVGTVRTHLASIYSKLGVSSRTAAVHSAHTRHLL